MGCDRNDNCSRQLYWIVAERRPDVHFLMQDLFDATVLLALGPWESLAYLYTR